MKQNIEDSEREAVIANNEIELLNQERTRLRIENVRDFFLFIPFHVFSRNAWWDNMLSSIRFIWASNRKSKAGPPRSVYILFTI